MVTTYGSHGQAHITLELFVQMLQSNVKPDKVTFLAILSACGHAGLVDEGCYYFYLMINIYGIIPRVKNPSPNPELWVSNNETRDLRIKRKKDGVFMVGNRIITTGK
ncbi:hypothetical protein VNO78_10133 [Psophocarpus tetragonolobus]|uniref:Pentatricopeptide repeat-containing protein n=1 Tax=Psophocarpus tetragonolobus TaxID=3891 RepID=A0AAN9SQI1_PSOTE